MDPMTQFSDQWGAFLSDFVTFVMDFFRQVLAAFLF
jgi:hypothetical protein